MSKKKLGDLVTEFAKRKSRGEKPRLKFSMNIADEIATLLKDAGFAIAQECIDRIQNPNDRRIISDMFFTTAAFAIGGIAIGGIIGGPTGAAVGGITGAVLGMCGYIVLKIVPDGNGRYVLV